MNAEGPAFDAGNPSHQISVLLPPGCAYAHIGGEGGGTRESEGGATFEIGGDEEG